MTRIRFTLLPLALTLAACGPRYSLKVPREQVEKLPYESRIELLEAENDLAIAVDRLDEAHNNVTRTRDAIRRAKSNEGAAENEEREAKDGPSRDVARLAIEEARARVDYLRVRQEVNLRQVDVEELALRCAFAHFEQAQQVAVVKAKVPGSERLKPEDFDKQVKECDADVAKERAAAKEVEKKVEAVRSAWEAKKGALARKTFDARASPYVE